MVHTPAHKALARVQEQAQAEQLQLRLQAQTAPTSARMVRMAVFSSSSFSSSVHRHFLRSTELVVHAVSLLAVTDEPLGYRCTLYTRRLHLYR